MKNTFTFQHEYGARNDPKIQDILFEVGAAGGFAWWVIVEMLYEQGGYLPRGKKTINQIAYSAHCDEAVVEYVIEKSGLFKMDKNRFWSEKVLFQLEERNNKSISAKRSAAAKWDKWKQAHNEQLSSTSQSEGYANAEQTQSEGYAKDKISKDKISNSVFIDINTYSPSSKAESENGAVEELFKDGDKKIINSNPNTTNTQSKPTKKINYDAVRDFWNDKVVAYAPEMSKATRLTDVRKAKIEVRFREFAEIDENPWRVYGQILDKIVHSKFARGDNDRGWKIDFGWIFENERNWVKVYEGKYDDRRPSSGAGMYPRDDANSEWE